MDQHVVRLRAQALQLEQPPVDRLGAGVGALHEVEAGDIQVACKDLLRLGDSGGGDDDNERREPPGHDKGKDGPRQNGHPREEPVLLLAASSHPRAGARGRDQRGILYVSASILL